MKRLILLAVFVSFSAGCQSIEKSFKGIESSIVGLPRCVTLYSANGDVIRKWEGKFKVFGDSTPYAGFITDNGKVVYLSGTYVIEEK